MERTPSSPPTKKSRFQEHPLTGELPLFAMMCTRQEKDGWLTKIQKDQLAQIFAIDVTGVRVHTKARNHTYTSEGQGNSRLSVMVDDTGKVSMMEGESQNKKNIPTMWKGISVFYNTNTKHHFDSNPSDN
jgi:hypothetical protein